MHKKLVIALGVILSSLVLTACNTIDEALRDSLAMGNPIYGGVPDSYAAMAYREGDWLRGAAASAYTYPDY